MTRFAVGYLNTFDNDLIVEVVEANSWHEAILKHHKAVDHFDEENQLPTDIDKAKQAFFDQDASIGFVQIPEIPNP